MASLFSADQVRLAESLLARAGVSRSLTPVGRDREDFVELHVDVLVELVQLARAPQRMADSAAALKDAGFGSVVVRTGTTLSVIDADIVDWAGNAAKRARRALGEGWTVSIRSLDGGSVKQLDCRWEGA